MYRPSHFAHDDRESLAAFMRARPLATLVVSTAQGLNANLVPLEYDPADGPHGCLRGHVARANPLWREALPGQPVLALFHGAQGYVSPGWYASKREHGKVVPTWNYAVVQARGELLVHDDGAWLRAFVGRLTDAHEAGRAQPWRVSDAPEDFVAQMLRAIVGIEIRLSALEGKFKLSQNRSADDVAGVLAALDGEATAETADLAAAMRALPPRAG